MNREKYNPVGINSGSYSGNDSIGMATGGICPKSYYEKEGYQIITAEQFLQANPQPSVQGEYAVGQWVTILKYEDGHPVGATVCITRNIPENNEVLCGKWYAGYDAIRPATEEEIRKATSRPDEIPVDGWKVGQELPEEWIIAQKQLHDGGPGAKTMYKTSVWSRCGTRKVEEVVDGYARISNTSTLWLPPKNQCIPLPEEKKGKLLSFKTEDGYELYEGDKVEWVYTNPVTTAGKPEMRGNITGVHENHASSIKDNTWKLFKHKANAEEWIKEQNDKKQNPWKHKWNIGDRFTNSSGKATGTILSVNEDEVELLTNSGRTAWKTRDYVDEKWGTEWLLMPKEQPLAPATNIGRKVRIVKGYTNNGGETEKYVGQEGTVEKVSSEGGVLNVRFSDGEVKEVWTPGSGCEEAVWVDEEVSANIPVTAENAVVGMVVRRSQQAIKNYDLTSAYETYVGNIKTIMPDYVKVDWDNGLGKETCYKWGDLVLVPGQVSIITGKVNTNQINNNKNQKTNNHEYRSNSSRSTEHTGRTLLLEDPTEFKGQRGYRRSGNPGNCGEQLGAAQYGHKGYGKVLEICQETTFTGY